jgi:hypothetical protein
MSSYIDVTKAYKCYSSARCVDQSVVERGCAVGS